MRPLAAMLLALTLTTAACAKSATTNRANTNVSAISGRAWVTVENRAFSDMTIYVLRGAERSRLGLVTGASTSTFEIPERMIFGTTALRFLADPIGGNQTPVSQEIGVQPGDTVVLTIPPQ
jgi:hypothetical protein